jgi:hypothetical protein
VSVFTGLFAVLSTFSQQLSFGDVMLIDNILTFPLSSPQMQKNRHNKFTITAACFMLVGLALFAHVCVYAAKGGGKEKKGYVLIFKGFDVRNAFQSRFTLQPGVHYKGSFNNVIVSPQQTTIQSIITYQKGNSTFIYPYHHKVSVPKFKTPEATRN